MFKLCTEDNNRFHIKTYDLQSNTTKTQKTLLINNVIDMFIFKLNSLIYVCYYKLFKKKVTSFNFTQSMDWFFLEFYIVHIIYVIKCNFVSVLSRLLYKDNYEILLKRLSRFRKTYNPLKWNFSKCLPIVRDQGGNLLNEPTGELLCWVSRIPTPPNVSQLFTSEEGDGVGNKAGSKRRQRFTPNTS